MSVAGGAVPAGAVEPVADGADAPAAHADSGCAYPVSETDATGTEVTVTGEPDRIVALGASTAQTLWELDADGKVVGVSQFGTYLDGAGDLEVVTEGFPAAVKTETIIGLNPDLVLAANVYDNESLQQLRDAPGITVYKFEAAGSIEDVYAKTERIGHLAGACEAANTTVAEMRGTVDTISEAVSGEERPHVLYPQTGGFAPGPNTFIGGLIDAAGGANVVANANATSPYPQLSGEFIVEQDPEWLVISAPPGQEDADPTELAPDNPALRNTTAWEEGNFVVVNTNNISQPAPRIVSPLRKMAQAFHPEAYAAANATPTEPGGTATPAGPTGTDAGTETPTEPTGTDAGTETPTEPVGTTTATEPGGTEMPTGTETESPGLPGFGMGVAVVALLALLLSTRRR
jgi:iron complex transport system substrate-binding protein